MVVFMETVLDRFETAAGGVLAAGAELTAEATDHRTLRAAILAVHRLGDRV